MGDILRSRLGLPGREIKLDLYAGKKGLVARLDPLVERLVRGGVLPDAVTLAAVPVAGLASVVLLISPTVPAALLAIPILAALRLVLNLLDGALARRTGRSRPRGELLNELGDRVCDIAFLAAPNRTLARLVAAPRWRTG